MPNQADPSIASCSQVSNEFLANEKHSNSIANDAPCKREMLLDNSSTAVNVSAHIINMLKELHKCN